MRIASGANILRFIVVNIYGQDRVIFHPMAVSMRSKGNHRIAHALETTLQRCVEGPDDVLALFKSYIRPLWSVIRDLSRKDL